MHSRNPASDTDIAIVAMAVRLPGARTMTEFWQKLASATECITTASDDELRRVGTPAALLSDPRYVRARSRVDDVERFDAEFFGMSPREAEITDPQHRIFLECAWEALEQAGYVADTRRYRIGVYAGSSLSTYLLYHIWPNPELLSSVGEFEALTANDKDYLATRVSYKLDLRGPSVTVQAACSTSLVAVHLACQSLIGGECDLALAGGVTIVLPQERGYLHRPGGIMAADGHCRAFDAAASGTVFGNGVGVAVLRRLDEALDADDTILAVIKGSAVNNDGAAKIGYTAPSIEGQTAVIVEALAVANLQPATIGYVEAHGTGTPLGDPIEVAALSKAFAGVPSGSCALGSVKTNIGHLDAAAGIAGLAKAVLALRERAIPASLHYERGNPEIDFAHSPFYVCADLRTWPSDATPRRAGVSSFGIGGTNAHVVLEEAPERSAAASAYPWHLLPISARTQAGLIAASRNLLDALTRVTDDDLSDVAYTLQAGRRRFTHRRALVVRDRRDAIRQLGREALGRDACTVDERVDRPVVFMFPGTGAQHPGVAKELYENEPFFQGPLDRCAGLLTPLLGHDIRSVLFGNATENATLLERTDLGQPCLFAIEYALARCWISWGVKPAAMIGYSLGEYVAACLAGVLSLEAALRLVATRAQLVQSASAGAMLVVDLPEDDVRSRIDTSLAVAGFIGPRRCIVSGATAKIAACEQSLAAEGVATQRLRTAHAFHSPMMDGLMEPLTREASRTSRDAPSIRYVSNVTGTWFSKDDAEDPAYWGRHLRQPVRFAEGWSRLCTLPDALFLEVGPGRSLAAIVRELERPEPVFPSLPHESSHDPDVAVMLSSLGRLWLAGASVSWSQLDRGVRRRRVPLPTYPFQRLRYWIAPTTSGHLPAETAAVQQATSEPSSVEQVHRTSIHPRPLLRTPFVEPTSDVERVVAGLWEELLGVSPIGLNDHFFELGGSSLLMTSAVSRLERAFPVSVPPRQVFASTTVAELSQLIEALLTDKIGALSEEEAERMLAELESSDEPLTR